MSQQFTVAKLNIGTAKTYQTQASLSRALMRAGAERVEFAPDAREVCVTWGDGVGDVRYTIDPAGAIDQQLAWDMEPM